MLSGLAMRHDSAWTHEIAPHWASHRETHLSGDRYDRVNSLDM
jgi:hypothetical protein